MISQGMQVWAVTGPIGAGKSTASLILAKHGAALIDGDQLGHQLLQQPQIQAEIAQQLGAKYVIEGIVDRQALGAYVFQNADALASLDEIMHGPLGRLAAEKLQDLAKLGEHKLAVFEAAVYFRLPTPPSVDMVLVINASAEVRRERLLQRGLSSDEVIRRLAAQKDLETQWSTADRILWNEGSLDELAQQLVALMAECHLGSESAS